MKADWKFVDRKQRLIGVAAISVVLAVAGFAAVRTSTSGISPIVDSGVLAKLVARSPGARVGGAALKAKKRVVRAPIRTALATPSELARPAVASVLSAATPPGIFDDIEPSVAPLDLFPQDFVAPGLGEAIPDSPPSGFTPVISNPGGGPIIVPPGGGGGIGGGGGGGTPPGFNPEPGPGPNPGPSPTPGPQPTPSPGPVPEPATWAMLILGFGAIGSSMRRRTVRYSIIA